MYSCLFGTLQLYEKLDVWTFPRFYFPRRLVGYFLILLGTKTPKIFVLQFVPSQTMASGVSQSKTLKKGKG